MAHLQYIPGDPHLVDQLVYELKSKGIFDQFRKDCIADVDTRPAYQNLRQRVENSVSTFLSRQTWQPDLNKNQLREKLRKHILDGNYLEQGVERIVDQVVNPKVASIFIPQVEDLVYNYLGISRKKLTVTDTSNGHEIDDLPNDLEAVSPGSVNNDDKDDNMDIEKSLQDMMQVDQENLKSDTKDNSNLLVGEKDKIDESQMSISDLTPPEPNIDKENIPFPSVDAIAAENIPSSEKSPPKLELDKIKLPKDTSTDIPLPDEMSVDIPLPDEIIEKNKEHYFKPINTDDDDSSSDSSLRRNMSPLTPIRNYNNENSCDAQQAFENESSDNREDKKEPSTFRFTIETKSPENTCDVKANISEKLDKDEKPDKIEKIDKNDKNVETNLTYQFNNKVNINNMNAPAYEDSSNSHNLQIDYESDVNSKYNLEAKVLENEQNSEDSKNVKKSDEKRSANKSSHKSRDSHKNSSSSRDKKNEKSSSSKDYSRHDKSKSSKEEKPKPGYKEKSREKYDKKDSKDSSRHRSSHKSSHKDSKSHRSSSSSHRHSGKHADDRKISSSSSNQKDKVKISDKDKIIKDKSRESRSNPHRSDKDRKGSSKSKHDDKGKDKKNKKDTDDHYSLSGRGNPNRRSTDRDSNDGSSSSKGSNNPSNSKSSQMKTDSKRSSKLDTTSTSGDSTSPSDKENIAFESGTQARELLKHKPIVRIEKNLETPVASPPRLPFVPDVTIRKPKIAANFEEAKKLMRMRKFLEEEQRRMNQEAALLLEFQANVRPSLSQVYSSVSGPELEFACITNNVENETSSLDENHRILDYNFESLEDNPQINNTIKINYKSDVKESEGSVPSHMNTSEQNEDVIAINNNLPDINNDDNQCKTKFFEVTIITEEISESEETDFIKQEAKPEIVDESKHIDVNEIDKELKYFAEHEKYDAELERAKHSEFFKKICRNELSNKLYLINCDTYTENIFREASKEFGDFNVVNYHRNGHLKINNPKTVKNLSKEVSLPLDIKYDTNQTNITQSNILNSPPFEFSGDYNAKLEEMVSKASRQEIMEIILGSVAEDSADMPKIDYCTESNIDISGVKRKYSNEDYSLNNNEHILKPTKMRKLSSEHISSTTPEGEEGQQQVILSNTRSKYLGRAGRVGLPKPRRTNLQNSPSSDKSVENYEQNTAAAQQSINGKIKPRNMVQRYEASDLYKPKLHYLSKRNNIT